MTPNNLADLVDDTRFPIKAKFPLEGKPNNLVDRRKHLWLNEEDYLDYLEELRLAKEGRVTLALSQVTEGLGNLSDEQLDKLADNLNKTLVSLGPTDEK